LAHQEIGDGCRGREGDQAARAGSDPQRKLDRRDVLKGLSTVPALGLFGYAWQKQRQYERARLEAASPAPAAGALDEINVALLGAGPRARCWWTRCSAYRPALPRGCDLWTEYNQRRVVNSLKRFGHQVNGYEDYREMLDREKDLDAVVVATPDFWHAQHAADCLKAGKHVYCEKEMSNTLEGARSMVAAARETAGFSRSATSAARIRVTSTATRSSSTRRSSSAASSPSTGSGTARWRRTWARRTATRSPRPAEEVRFPEHAPVSQLEVVQRPRWRPIVDLGSHQIDIYRWFLGANPSQVMASGGLLYYDPATHEWYDTVMAVYDFETPQGPVKAYYRRRRPRQPGLLRELHGDQGTLLISESELNYSGKLYRDRTRRRGTSGSGRATSPRRRSRSCRRRRTQVPSPTCANRFPPTSTRCRWPCATRITSRTCRTSSTPCAARPSSTAPEVGFESAVSVLRVNEAIEARPRFPSNPMTSGSREHRHGGEQNAPDAMIAITVLRVLVGWHFLYEGIAKLTSVSWSASGYLKQARGPFADLFKWLAADPNMLAYADQITMWGLTAVGVLLVLGCSPGWRAW